MAEAENKNLNDFTEMVEYWDKARTIWEDMGGLNSGIGFIGNIYLLKSVNKLAADLLFGFAESKSLAVKQFDGNDGNTNYYCIYKKTTISLHDAY